MARCLSLGTVREIIFVMNILNVDAILAGLTIIGGLSVAILVLTSRKVECLQTWRKVAFAMFGCAVAVWGVLKCVLTSKILVLSEGAYSRIADTKTLIGGFAIGIMVTLMLRRWADRANPLSSPQGAKLP
jgi:hypothetical protein